MPGLEFLDAMNTGQRIEVGRKVVVVGGGNTAMDVARSALRLGAEVTVLYRRTRAEMPAIEDEVREAQEEGVQFKFLGIPHRIDSQDGRIVEVVCQEMELGEPDESGRRRPIPKPDSFFTLPADMLLTATGELPDTEAFDKVMQIENGLIVTDEFGRTSHRKVFAGGDVVTGASTVVNAVARGRGAAELITAQLQGSEFNPKERKKVVAVADVNTAYFVHKDRMRLPHAGNVRGNFDEVHKGFSDREIQSEMERCFSCGVCDGCDNCYVFCPDVAITRQNGVYTIDYDYCKGCLICVQECPRGVISTESEAM
jgi:NADPH-dependent glutamate synthase beta subunit-like oxidoreductase